MCKADAGLRNPWFIEVIVSSAFANFVTKATPYVQAAKKWVTANPGAVAQTADLMYSVYRDHRAWAREDNAYRRAAKDMDLAGLNSFNSGSVSPSASSPSSAMTNFIALKQLSQKDRELSQRDKEIENARRVADANVASAEYGMFGKYAGTKFSKLLDETLTTTAMKIMESSKRRTETRTSKEKDGKDPFLPDKKYPQTYFDGVLDWIARRGLNADFY